MGLNGYFTYPKINSVYNGRLERDFKVMWRNFFARFIVLYEEQEKDGNAS